MNKIPEITIHNSLSLPVIGLGTWEMGGRQSPDKQHDSKWIDAIETAIGMGIRHIDTAAIYGGGHTETLVGEAIRNFNRNDYFITTKVSGEHLQFADVIRSVKSSKNRLKVEQIDMLLLHWPSPTVPLEQTISAITKLFDDGLIRYFGLSNFPVKTIREIGFYTDAPIITNQLEYNLFNRNQGIYTPNVESEIIPFCLKNGISITAWRPLLKGDTTTAAHPLLDSIAAKYGKTVFQIMLNWLIHKPMMMAIPRMGSADHIKQNIEALHFNMEEEDILLLDGIAK